MLSKEIRPKRGARREVYCRGPLRHFMIGKEYSAVQFKEWSNVPTCGEYPFKAHRIYSCPVSGVGPLKHNKRRHRIDRKLESSAEKTRQLRPGQYPPISKTHVPHIGIFRAAWNRVSAASPHLDLMTAVLRTVLGNRKR